MITPKQVQSPAYVSRFELAGQLSISERSVEELVRRGILPGPTKLSSRGPKWSWRAVEDALSYGPGSPAGARVWNRQHRY
jgi:hypothetical protein